MLSMLGVFVGHTDRTKGWLVAAGNVIHDSSHVVFREDSTRGLSFAQVADLYSDSDSNSGVATGDTDVHDAPPPADPAQIIPAHPPRVALPFKQIQQIT